MPKQMNPQQAGFFMPAEWAPHQAVWLAWPSHADLWLENLPQVQAEFVQFCKQVSNLDAGGKARGEHIHVLVPTADAGNEAETHLRGLPVSIHLIPFGDIWLRDTSSLFLKNQNGDKAYVSFGFNGWGGKYVLPHDTEVSHAIGRASGLNGFSTPFILEGGSIEIDGEGTCLTTRQCLLNANRNAGSTQKEIEEQLGNWLGIEKVLWLGDGLINDHTDGHIDTMARFSAPGVVLAMKATDTSDPNRQILEKIISDLEAMVDAKGRKLKVVQIPSPGAIFNEEGRLMPASYLNFYIANSTVVVPTYGSNNDNDAVRAIAECFPDRLTIGVSARAILTGGGAFHCMSQQEPR